MGIGDSKVAQGENTIVTYALGSCVGVCIYDEGNGVGGMLHAMLPSFAHASSSEALPLKYVDSGMESLYRTLCHMGADKNRMKAKLVGGAKMFDFTTAESDMDIGTANVLQAKESLRKLGISLVREVTGGEVGRTIRFVPASGNVTIYASDSSTETI